MDDIQHMTEEEVKEATLDLIWYPGIWMWDGLVVLLHLFLIAILTIPLIIFVILNQSEYSPWSLNDPDTLIFWSDLTIDPKRLFINIFRWSFHWNVAIIIFVISFFCFKIFGLFSYYATMTFPVNRLLQVNENQKNSFLAFLKFLEWLSFAVVLFVYFLYIGILLMWLLLGAFISPNAFLPLASAAATFGTFVVAKYRTFKDLYKMGSEKIMDYLNVMFSELISSVANKLTLEMKGITGSLSSEVHSFLQNGPVKELKEKMVDSGLVDINMINDFEKKVKEISSQSIISRITDVLKDPSIIAENLKSLKEELDRNLVNFLINSFTNLI